MAGLNDLLRENGIATPAGGVSPGVSQLTQADLNVLLGRPTSKPVIVPGYLPTTTKQTPTGALVSATLNQDDQYGIALGKERTRMQQAREAYLAEQSHTRDKLATTAGDLAKQAAAAQEAFNAQWIIYQQFANAGKLAQWRPSVDINELRSKYEALKAQADAAYKAVQDFDGSYAANLEKFMSPMQKNYDDAVALAQTLRDNKTQQGKYDEAYARARAAYESAVTQHDKDQAAYDMYLAQKRQYDDDAAQRQADIAAGRYAVNPYLFMAQGASLDEIAKLKEQMDAGNLRPNMRVPDAPVAPTEVKDPGQFALTAPVHERVTGPQITNTAAADILGYKAPAAPAADAALPTVKTEPTDTSSVTSNYSTPEVTPDKPAPKVDTTPRDSSGNVDTTKVQGAGTLQQTATTVAQPTQQTATQQAEPAPALPAQTSGAVSGQENNTGQEEQTPPPVTQEKPAPFTADEEKKDEQDNVWE